MRTVGKSGVPGFSVKAACERVGIGPHTLRAWETRYHAVQPRRSESGQRLYSVLDIKRLQTIVTLVNFGHSVGVVARLTDHELVRLLRRAVPDKVSGQTGTGLSSWLVKDFEHDLRCFNINGISSLLDQKRTVLGGRAFVLDVLAPLMAWIGTSVEQGELSVAHEHALSAVVRDQIYQTLRYGSAPVHTIQQMRFILAAPEDDLHEFGILMSATLLAHYGIPNHLLGANLPAEALAIAVKAVGGGVVILSNAPVPESERRVSFQDYLVELHALIPKHVEIWIGGSGKIPHLRTVLSGRVHRLLSSFRELDSVVAKTAARRTKRR